MHRSNVVLFALLTPAILHGWPPEVRGELTLAEVIENVRQNERLYKDIEVSIKQTYDIGERKPEAPDIVFRQQMRTRFISQGEWFRLEREGKSEDLTRAASLDRIRAFDGRTTRVLEQKAVGNISPERLEDENFIRPHLLLIRYAHVAVPLSVYLSGQQAIQSHPNGRWYDDVAMQVTYEGEATFQGLKCHKVLAKTTFRKSGEPHGRKEFWLAEDRNDLPVRLLSYLYRSSKDIPVVQGVVHEMREIRPGVWFPYDVAITSYNKFKIQRERVQELQWRERYLVEQAKLDPQYDREFFSKVDFPAGIAMYEVVNGEIKRSWRQGGPGVE